MFFFLQWDNTIIYTYAFTEIVISSQASFFARPDTPPDPHPLNFPKSTSSLLRTSLQRITFSDSTQFEQRFTLSGSIVVVVRLLSKIFAKLHATISFLTSTKESVVWGRLEHYKIPQIFTQLSVVLSLFYEYGFEGKLS